MNEISLYYQQTANYNLSIGWDLSFGSHLEDIAAMALRIKEGVGQAQAKYGDVVIRVRGNDPVFAFQVYLMSSHIKSLNGAISEVVAKAGTPVAAEGSHDIIDAVLIHYGARLRR